MTRPATVDGGELVARTLKQFGVEVAFGLHGGHLDSLLVGLRRNGIHLVDTRHEAVAANAADGKPACINLTVSGEVVHPITSSMVGYTDDPDTIVIPYYDNVPRR
jgi:thiamine pyrophosphate-dependent acetolactate synthase large subunit-like protein